MKLLGSLRNRLILGLGLLLVLFIVVGGLGITSLRYLSRAIDEELQVLGLGSSLSTQLVSSAAGQIRAAEAFLLEPSPELGAEFLSLGDTSHATRNQYRFLPGLTARDQGILNRISQSQARLEVGYATAHVLRDSGLLEEARRAAAQARSSGDTLVALVQELTRSQQASVAQRVEAFRRLAAERRTLVLVLLAAAIVLGGATAWLTVRSIEAPLGDLSEAARRFGEGDLRAAQLGDMPRELAPLAHAMAAMGQRLRAVIDSTITESRGISLSAGDLSAMSEELAASSHEIVRAIGAVTAGAEAQVREVRSSEALLARLREGAAQDLTATQRVVTLGESTRSLASRHAEQLGNAARELGALREDIRRAAAETRELQRMVDRVGEVGDVARQLASESDVLALNASVEAARERAAGGGFATVAEETRRLADSSRLAADRVSDSVEAVHERTAAVMGTLQGAAAKAADGEAAARRSVVAFEEIGRLVDAMREIAARVARSSEESKDVGARFAELRADLEKVAQENVLSAESVTSAATQQSEATDDIATSAAGLLEASERLAALVAGFKT